MSRIPIGWGAGGASTNKKTLAVINTASVPIPNRRIVNRSIFTRHHLPASARRAFALSVFSHVNSGSVRPKCPNAAVFL
jgi:hypothetical protein